MSFPVLCHRCPVPRFIGESAHPWRFSGVVEVPKDRMEVPTPRAAYRCAECGWWTIVKPVASTREMAPWRRIELKRGA